MCMNQSSSHGVRRRTRVTARARLLAVLGVVVAAMVGDASHGLAAPAESPVVAAVSAQARSRARRPHESRIWFHPLPAPAAWPNGPRRGSRDFLGLFQANAAWPRAMAHVGVMGMYAGWIAAASDQELQRTVAFLNAHGMGIEIEAPALQATPTCGSGVEGYAPRGLSLYEFTLAYLQRSEEQTPELQST